MPNPPPSMIRVAIIGDDRVLAESLGLLIAAESDLQFVGHAPTQRLALDLLAVGRADVVLLELDLAGTDGLQFARGLLARWPTVRLVILADAEDDQRLPPALLLGARVWLLKSSGVDLLLAGIRGAFHGETHVPPQLLTQVLESLRRGVAQPQQHAAAELIARLSVREREVLRGMVDGKGRQDIAEWLGMSPNTARTHIQNVLRKLNVDSAVGAVALARRANQELHLPARSEDGE